jgi:F-type H+-transporting ATPase subunit alpha
MLRLEMAQFRELAAFSQFGSDLDKATMAQLNRGRRLGEILKQDQYKPLPVEKQITIIFAGTGGYLDDLPIDQCLPFEQALYDFMDTSYPGVGQQIAEKKEINDSLRAEMRKMLDEFKAKFVAENKVKAEDKTKAEDAAKVEDKTKTENKVQAEDKTQVENQAKAS